MAKIITDTNPKTLRELKTTMNNLPQINKKESFYLHHTNGNEVKKAIKNLRSFCSTGNNNIAVSSSSRII